MTIPIPKDVVAAGERFLDDWHNQWNGEPFTHAFLAECVLGAAMSVGNVQHTWRTGRSTQSQESGWQQEQRSEGAARQRYEWLEEYPDRYLEVMTMVIWPNGVTINSGWRRVEP
jgi:hypothetical protein